MDFIKEKGRQCPDCSTNFYRYPARQPDAQDLPGGLPRTLRANCGLVSLRPPRVLFVNFSNLQCTTRRKLPFGVSQIGKSLPQRDHPGQSHLPHP